jgi:MYXO-CTERM domain-containing protein
LLKELADVVVECPLINLGKNISGFPRAWSLPIRIGTTVSPGVQEVVIYALADQRASISNFPEAVLEDECMFPAEVEDYGAFYAGELDSAFTTGLWLTEYAWSPSGCDPCSSDPPDAALLESVGGSESGMITRIRARYTPGQATQDLGLYESASEYDQVRYIEYLEELESTLPVCGIGLVQNPGECEEASGAGRNDETGDLDGGKAAGCGCGAGPGPTGLGLLTAVLLLRRRFRDDLAG